MNKIFSKVLKLLIVLCFIAILAGFTGTYTNMTTRLHAQDNAGGSTARLTEALPQEIMGWKKSAKTVIYTPDNLFEYINGGAELYISYDFVNLAAISYKNKNDAQMPEIKVDIFDMSRSANAFGVFAHSKEKSDHFIAPEVESEYAAGLLTFWKGRYYVAILAYPETAEKKKLVQTLGRAIAAQIKENSVKPPLIEKLPSSSQAGGAVLDTASIRYFRHYIWLNSYYFISDKNILNLDKDTEAVIAKYKWEPAAQHSTLLLLVDYANDAAAAAGLNYFLEQYLPQHKAGFQQRQDGRWSGGIRVGKQLNIVLNAPDLHKARLLCGLENTQ